MPADLTWGAFVFDLIKRLVSDLTAIVGLSDLSWGVAIVGTPIFIAGLGLEELGKYLSRSKATRTAQLLIIWPCTILGYI